MPKPSRSSLQKAFRSFWKWKYRNYVLITVLFLVWILFFSPNTLSTQIKARRENRELKELKAFYLEEIRKNEDLIRKLQSDSGFAETYGRETYLMKADDEDIYLFVEEEASARKGILKFFKRKSAGEQASEAQAPIGKNAEERQNTEEHPGEQP